MRILIHSNFWHKDGIKDEGICMQQKFDHSIWSKYWFICISYKKSSSRLLGVNEIALIYKQKF